MIAGTKCKARAKTKSNENIQVIQINLEEKGEWSKAVFAGGCFWCMEPPFDKLLGVKATISGYAGGKTKKPSYEEVSSGSTDHIESILILYDSKKINFSNLVEVFWQNIDPTQVDGQFYDTGNHYKTIIFYLNEKQKKLAEESKNRLTQSKRFQKPIVTNIFPIQEFWQAEEYHQNYYKKNPIHYYNYRKNSGRDSFIEQHWKKTNKIKLF